MSAFSALGRGDPRGSPAALLLITKHHGLGASTIASIYKDRGQIELFFKAIKQNLKIKTFVGTSTNEAKTKL